jgi:hypothetical protein
LVRKPTPLHLPASIAAGTSAFLTPQFEKMRIRLLVSGSQLSESKPGSHFPPFLVAPISVSISISVSASLHHVHGMIQSAAGLVNVPERAHL